MRIVHNLITLRELTAEDEYRKAKGLPPKEDLSPYDILEKYKHDPSIMISFRDVYYTKTKRIAVNFKSNFETPSGIYCYPLNVMWGNFDHTNRQLDNIPFTGELKPKSIVILKLKGKGLILNNYNKQRFTNDLSILQNKYSEFLNDKAIETIKKKSSIYFKRKSEPYIYSIDKSNYFIWSITREISLNYKKNKNSNFWNLIFSRDLGYNWILDYDLSIIHENEPTQCLILKNEGYDLIDSIDISKIDYTASTEDLTIYSKLFDYFIQKKLSVTKLKNILSQYPDIINYKKNEDTFLSLAYKYGQFHIIEFLLAQPNIDVNIQNTSGLTYLHIGCKNNDARFLELLLSHPDIDVNIQDKKGDTALSIAKDEKIKKLLIQHGAIE